MSAISLQEGIVYGPILSRRLGRSLGINLMPTDHKVCSFNCIYCQYGETSVHTISPPAKNLPDVSDVITAVEKALKKPRTIDYLTFSGNGESTLHPNFFEIVTVVMELRDRYRPNAKLAILSNSSTVNQPEVTGALKLIDAPMMKLDAGDEESFLKINRPSRTVTLVDIIKGLKTLPNLMIQSIMMDGEISNSRGDGYEAWISLLGELNPLQVHLYATERPTACTGIRCLKPDELIRIEEDINSRFGLSAIAYWGG